MKRKITFGNYDTAANGWTLTSWKLSAAEQRTKYMDKTSGDGSWDLSTALTDGLLRYNDRTLTATFECSEGDRLSREAKIRQMVNQLDGERLNIELPDAPFHYVTGRLHVVREYNDNAHAAVTVSARCEPWKYASAETVITATLGGSAQTLQLVNGGKRALVPVLTVTGESVAVNFGAESTTLTVGTHQWPELLLTPGTHELTVSGTGQVTVTYREAVLE